MNKTLLVTVIILTSSAFAGPKSSPPKPVSFELRAAAFMPMGERFKEVYGTVGLSLQTEVTRAFNKHPNLGVWGNLEWIFMDRQRHRCHYSTHIDIVNISSGFKMMGYFYDDTVVLSAAMGPDLGFVFFENRMQCCKSCPKKHFKEHKYKAAVGGIFKTAFQYYFTHRFNFDLFVDYLYLPVHFRHTENVGGFKVGGGFGLRF